GRGPIERLWVGLGNGERLVARDVPHGRGAVDAGGDDPGAVLRELDARHGADVPREHPQIAARPRVPDAHLLVAAGGDEESAVGTPRDAVHPAEWMRPLLSLLV